MEQSSTTDCLYRRQLQKLIPSITGAVESEMQAQHNSVEILVFTEEPKYQLQTGQNSGFICFWIFSEYLRCIYTCKIINGNVPS